jgi:hypothetical protein
MEITPLEVYIEEVLAQTQRLLGLMDRNPMSATYGCFDRQYWQYNVTDVPSVRCQEAVLTLTLLYTINHGKNPYYQNKLILKWIHACLNFWVKIQERNGSFNEWYPKENSYVATAFSCYAVSETLLILENRLNNRLEVTEALKKACNWLLKNNEQRVLNQESGATMALLNLYLLTGDSLYKKESEKKVAFLKSKQNIESWWKEYDGPDIGYLSLTIDYLAKYYQKEKNDDVLKMLEGALEFISYFVHPNFTFGGEYGSRNTEYMIPSGFEYLASTNENAHAISQAVRTAILNKTTISPFSLDDRYLTYITYTWLQGYINAKPILKSSNEKSNKDLQYKHHLEFTKNFKEAKLLIRSTKDFYLIVNYGKGGSFKLFRKNNSSNCLPVYDSGIIVNLDAENLTSGIKEEGNQAEFTENTITISGNLVKMKSNTLTPGKNLLVRGFQFTAGRSEKVSMFFKEKMRDRLITKNLTSNIKFSRKITVQQDEIIVEDSIQDSEQIKKIIIGGKFACIYTPSSKYFQISESKNIYEEYTRKDLTTELTDRKNNLIKVRSFRIKP